MKNNLGFWPPESFSVHYRDMSVTSQTRSKKSVLRQFDAFSLGWTFGLLELDLQHFLEIYEMFEMGLMDINFGLSEEYDEPRSFPKTRTNPESPN